MVRWPWLAGLPLIVTFLLTPISASCPDEASIRPCLCTTRGDELQIWCGHSELEPVLGALKKLGSAVTRTLDELILENNVIPALPGRAFEGLRVSRLMLRDNKLERVAANWLAGLGEHLLEVFLVEPGMRSLPEESLDGLSRLEAVTIQAGHVTRMPSFSNLPSLRYVSTLLPELAKLPPAKFRGLGALEELHLTGSGQLASLEAGLFQDLPRLSLLNLSFCGVSWLHPRALTLLPSLRTLVLSGNRLVDAGQVGRSIRELPVLSSLKLDRNGFTTLKETSFVDIPPLQEIFLNKNKIVGIHAGAFHRLPSLKLLDLSDNKIQRISPEFFLQSHDSGLETLNLMGNDIDHVVNLRVILDALPRLRYLDLSRNKLQDIQFGSIRGHQLLERLHLDHNQLKQVVREAFSGMPELRELRLRNNSLSNYLEMPLWNLPALKGLDLAFNEFHRLDRRVLANLPSLRHLDVSRNRLLVVDPASFLNTPSLERLNLSHNAVDNLAPQTLRQLEGLFELDLSGNRLGGLAGGLPKGLEHLHLAANHISSLFTPDLLLPGLRTLDLSRNHLRHLPPEGLASMPLLTKLFLGENSIQSIPEKALDGLVKLENLDLRENRITAIGKNALRELRSLRKLNICGNRLEGLGEGWLSENGELEALDLSQNHISDLPSAALLRNRHLREVSLASNALHNFPQAVASLPNLEKLDLSFNRISQIGEPISRMGGLSELRLAGNKLSTLLPGSFSGMVNLTSLDLEANEIELVTAHIVRSLPALERLRLSRNKLRTVPSAAFSDLPSLLMVELQENQLTQLASDAFSGVPGLLALNLSHNQLTSLDKAGLHGLRSLEVLDLSHNRLSRFNSHNMPALDSLLQLKMDGNRLCSIQGSPFMKMSHLRMLSLRNNKLSSLSEQTFEPLRSSMYQLDLDGNPLRCSCGLLWIQPWLALSPDPGPRCADGSLLRDYRLARQACSEAREVESECEEPRDTGSSLPFPPVQEKPLPHESDYFYEEYIEFDDHSSASLNSSQVDQLVSSTGLPLPALSSSIPPGVMSHFIPGDTPTIYAGTKPDTEEGKGSKPAAGTTFTFFGMPLPSLNLGKFWGSTRNADGKSRAPSKSTSQASPGVSSTKVESGFRPMVPVSSGFRPVFNPFNSSGSSHREESKKYTIQRISLRNATQFEEIEPQASKNYTKYDHSVKYEIDGGGSRQMGAGLAVKQGEERKPSDTLAGASSSLAGSSSFAGTSSKLPGLTSGLTGATNSIPGTPLIRDQGPLFQYNRLESDEPLTTDPGLSEEEPTPEPFPVNRGPASLSGFLAPGGQLPPNRPQGIPTITKVTVTPPSSLMPVAEEIHSPPRQPKSSPDHLFNSPTEASRKTSLKNSSLAWYYENYNNSNLEPYVGRVGVGSARSAWSPSPALILTFSALHLIPRPLL